MGIAPSKSQSLAHIDVKSDNPFDLFKEWFSEAKTFSTGSPSAFCLSTVSKNLSVTSRHLLLRRLEQDGFVFITDNRSKKVKDLMEVPNAAICFLWSYMNDQQEHITRQVRIKGFVDQLPVDQYVDIYNKEPLNFKIRSFLGPQGKEVVWEEQQKEYQKILDEVSSGQSLPMPNHLGGFKLYPRTMEFYFGLDEVIGDRVLFKRDSTTGLWSHTNLAA